jgi:microcystin-dependent protein
MNNVPTQSAGSSGVVASDWNTYVRDNFDAIKSGHVVCTSSTRPTGVDEGTMIYESDTQKVLIYNAGWVEVMDLDNTGAAPAALVPFLAPVGSIMQYAAASEPSGWVFCQGQELAIGSAGSTYYGLSSLLGTSYGALTNGSGGAGSSHFRVPDFRGRIPIGLGTNADVGTLSSNDGVTNVDLRTPKHKHTLNGAITNAGVITTGGHSVDHSHGGTTGGESGHTHTVNMVSQTDYQAGSNRTGLRPGGSYATAGAAGTHTHAFSTGGVSADHTHNVPDHGHANTFTVGPQVASSALDTLPYAVVNYIIKY